MCRTYTRVRTIISSYNRRHTDIPHVFVPFADVLVSIYEQRYDETSECAYDPTRLNFAIHIRMGDRRDMLRASLEYFLFLEAFMDTVSKEVVRKGLQPPLFHAFSEALMPCPSEDMGTFDEFPVWPVHQVRKI